jgi:hypothetical protein
MRVAAATIPFIPAKAGIQNNAFTWVPAFAGTNGL